MLIAALSFGLNTLLPAMAMARAAETGQQIVVCTANGYKTIRLEAEDTPRPREERQKGHDCAFCYGCGHYVARPIAPDAAIVVQAQAPVRPDNISPCYSPETRGSGPRGPPHLA